MSLLVLFFAILGMTVAGPLNGVELNPSLINADGSIKNSLLEQLVLDLLEDLRNTMLNGAQDIPVLDPLTLNGVSVDGDIVGLPGSHVSAAEITVDNLSTFEVHSLSITLTSLWLQRYTLTFDGSIPTLGAQAEYYDLDVIAMGYSIFGNGKARLALIQPRVSGSVFLTASIGIISGINLQVASADLKFELAGFESDIRGLFGNEAASNFANSFLEYLVPDIVLLYEAEVSAFLNQFIPDIANDILDNIDLGGILG